MLLYNPPRSKIRIAAYLPYRAKTKDRLAAHHNGDSHDQCSDSRVECKAKKADDFGFVVSHVLADRVDRGIYVIGIDCCV